ncbi:TetR/AcrR family transcriptional regulator [Rhodococcoides yunnanense]|uniref:TetR/AcrR family transcriptional regulator n=1 Tax=Rhodococcoides yunnanense TaxID=278209 RepID=UPI0022B14DE9|nr:helix-turn-helix domain-containing protein [Rhodococcus yunnanensis]MCZ4278355.1 helix-turn-helix domain containing protein [Rhodococcus yunnanensis]
MTKPSAGRSGRPRDTSIDDRVLSATRELLMEHGWDDLSVRGVAARAGVGRTTIDRRWSSKAELVLHAILGRTPDLTPFDGTDPAGWVQWVATGSRELFAQPEVRAAVPGLLSTFARNEDLRRQLWLSFSGPPAELFSADSPRDPEDAALDARALLAMAAGASLFLSTVATEDDTDAVHARIGELLLASIRRV